MQEIKPNDNKPLDPRPSRIARVIIVDDSAIVRQVLQVQLSRQPASRSSQPPPIPSPHARKSSRSNLTASSSTSKCRAWMD